MGQGHTLTLYAALAEKERTLISERTKAGLQAAKRSGRQLGMRAKPSRAQKQIAMLGAQANRDAALERLKSLKLDKHIPDALAGDRPLRGAAQWLNERGIASPGGGALACAVAAQGC
jgi:resolvase-like protein